MTISDQAPPLELLAAQPPPTVRRPGQQPAPRLADLQLDAEALVFGGGRIRVRALIERPDDRPVSLWIRVAGGEYEVPVRGCTAETELEFSEVEWWWPRAHGQQARHPVRVSLLGPDAELLDSVRRRIGFRWAQWATEPDQSGNPCILIVNGHPVRVRGVDWTSGPATEAVGRDHYQRRLGELDRANVNLLRIRDGRFESDEFYDLCDQLGLLVWQDLGAPRRTDGAAGRAALELRVRTGLARVASHPCIVMLHLRDDAPAEIARLAAELAPVIPVAAEPALAAASIQEGACVPVRPQPRFITMLGAPATPSLGKAPDAQDGTRAPVQPIAQQEPGDLAAALELAAELVRSRLKPEQRAGVLIARGTPTPGSALSGSGLLRQVVGRACADRLLTLQPDQNGLALCLLNDNADVFAGEARIRRLSLAGAELASCVTDLLVWSHSAQIRRLPDTILRPANPVAELVIAEAGGLRAVWFFDPAPALARPIWRVTITPEAESLLVSATPNVLVRDACLILPGHAEVEVEGGPEILLPGETAHFRVRGHGLDVAELSRSLVLTCRNEAGGQQSPEPVAAG